MSWPISRAVLQLSSRSSRTLAPRSTILFRGSAPPSTWSSSCNLNRPFTSSPSLQKKQKNTKAAHSRTDSPPLASELSPSPTSQAADLSLVEASILKAIERLTHDLAQLRAGGRFNPDLVEGLKVHLGTQSSGKQTVKLRDIAQVVPKGRLLNVIVGEQEHIKPVMSAIAASGYNLSPQQPHHEQPLTVPVPVPPPTGESRRAALETAQKAADAADRAIHDARAAHHKKLSKFRVEKSILPDDFQKAGKMLEEVVKKGHSEVKRIVDGAKKVLESQ